MLPNPLSLLTGIVNGVVSYLQQKRIQANFNSVFDSLITIVQWVGGGFDGIADAMYQEWGAVGWVTQHLGDIYDQVINLENSHEQSLSWIAFTMLPNSLGYLEHNIYVGWIQPMGVEIAQLRAQTKDLYARLGQVWTEVFNNLRPDVNGLLQFEDAFKTGDQPSINVLIDWLRNPSHFSDFAVPRIADPLAVYLNAPDHEQAHKGFAYVMVDVWDDEATAIWDAVARWLTADT